MKNELNDLLIVAKNEIANCSNLHELIHVIKPKVSGKDSRLMQKFQELKNASIEEKKTLGVQLNVAKNEIELAIKNHLSFLESLELNKEMEKIDITIPVNNNIGTIHPISFVINEVVNVFSEMGFALKEGPEIENDYYNFTALNVPMFHPARQMQDTFYIKNSNANELLRTHTTCVDIRQAKGMTPPFKFFSVGKVYRVDSDKTHSPMFHQVDLLYLDKNLGMADLKHYIYKFLEKFFKKENIKLNFRPSYFPFTSPSVEVDIYYHIKDGKMIFGEGDLTLEILGAGILHPNVLNEMQIDATEYSAIAFGCGIERIAMLKYGMNDIREFYNCNHKWLDNFNFSIKDLE
jgi:phenylalanyl-tRNA synthetase alpha chain